MSSQFETALADVENKAAATLKLALSVTGELKKAKAAATTGQTKDLRKSLASAATLSAELSQVTSSVASSFDFDDQEYLSSGDYTKELLEAAASEDLSMFEEDERLLCYPSLVRVIPGDLAIEVDKKRERRLRPSVVVAMLRSRQTKGVRFKPEPFLTSLESAYDFVTAQQDKQVGAVVRLVDVWAVLTLLPGQSREYTKQEFARDLYLLDQSSVTNTPKSQRQLRWSASTGTKGAGVLTTVARNGQQQIYWGIAFS